MGLEHSIKDDGEQTMRCPCCKHVSTVRVGDNDPYVSLTAGANGPYFVCQNPKCAVERIYSENAVMTGGRDAK
jgi:hypothetical protein